MKRSLIIALFSSILIVKVIFSLSTLYFHCENGQNLNALIMQIEIEHEEPACEDLNKTTVKFISSNYSKYQSLLNYYNSVVQEQTNYINHYPINLQFTFEAIQPPEFAS